MKIKTVSIHNFRSIGDAEFNLSDYSILVGANSSGKTNILTALRIFYEDEIKFDARTDFPKFPTKDAESWIDVEYELTPLELAALKKEYQKSGNTMKVRKYLLSSNKDKVATGQSNIYGYENGILSSNLFYGYKNISQSKLGHVIYIPETAATDETMKLSGPSPLRNMITFVVENIVEDSKSFESLTKSFEEFNKDFIKEETEDGFSINNLKKDINDNLSDWNIEFGLEINPLKPGEIVKSLISHSILDKNLNQEILLKNTGQGLQRHLIYTLLRLQSFYIEKKGKSKDFSPELTLLLFEEPEAYLHPCQQECQNRSLRTLGSQPSQQVLISTHSPVFVSKNIDDLPALVRLKKESCCTQIFQVTEQTRKRIIEQNSELGQYLRNKLDDPNVTVAAKEIIERNLGDTPEARQMEEESIRYLLWLNSTRCSAFFADIVVICEGATEKTFIEYLVENEWDDPKYRRACFLDALGKYNIHRYMNLFKELGIPHSVLFDKDENHEYQELINAFVEGQKNNCTRQVYGFDKDIETFLGIPHPPANRPDKKPLNLMWHYFNGKISENKVNDIRHIVESLLT